MLYLSLSPWQPVLSPFQPTGDKTVTVAMTPNGYADAPVGDRFVLPHEEQMKMRDFLQLLNNERSKDVVYIQKQNSSFTDEFSELIPDAGNYYLYRHFLFIPMFMRYVNHTTLFERSYDIHEFHFIEIEISQN